MIKAIIFDCFGVLYPDTYWTMARKYLGSDLSGKYDELHELVEKVDLGKITRDDLWIKFGAIVGKDADSIYRELKDMGGLDSRLLKFIEDNHQKYKFGMISNVGQGFINRMFVDKPAEHYFDSLVLSSEVGLVKPDKKIYLLGAENLDLSPNQCVFIDDLDKNVQGAIDAGMQALKYRDYDSFIKNISELLNMADANE